MSYISMEVPLAALGLGRLGQGHDACCPWVEVLHEALDGAALTGRVTALEQDHMFGAGLLGQSWNFSSSICSAYFSSSYRSRSMRSSYG
jgi:hypothetical protein